MRLKKVEVTKTRLALFLLKGIFRNTGGILVTLE
jgi:hypothetical protein